MTRRKRAKYEVMEIDAETIENFILTDYRRQIRLSQVDLLETELSEDRTFKSPIHINLMNGKYRVIDGTHRMEAVKRYLKKEPSEALEIPFSVYTGLTEHEEKDLYDVLAKTVGQTKSDFIKIHFNEIPLFNWIDQKFPVRTSIYSTKEALSYANLLVLWLFREKDELSSPRKEALINYAKILSRADYSEMMDFFERYKTTFGDPAQTSPYYKLYSLWVVATLWFRNKNIVEKEELWKLLRSKLMNNLMLLDTAKAGRREFAIDARRMLLEKLNQSWRGTRLV